ncbi:hypothetical protein F5884DRAFT_800741 [Xylogone sp. PMI_703]|nr:hypothetical protein F5884DRAFT_800741 [Xylogone sp. PMI_703]
MSSSKPRKTRHTTAPASKPAPSSSTAFPTSFLFIVNELVTNDDPDAENSIPQNIVDGGRWRPPNFIQGFFPQRPGHVYRWRNGDIELASSYQWHDDLVYGEDGTPLANGYILGPRGQRPQYYESMTVFYCNQFDHFFATSGDATVSNRLPGTENGWLPLTFEHRQHGHQNISDVYLGAGQLHLQVRNARWIDQILPQVYCWPWDGPTEGGLAGSLPLLIALIAFSCEDVNLEQILIHDHAWRHCIWHGHRRASGRRERRGMVVTVFLDPSNQSSTHENLFELESRNGPLIQ